MADRQSESSQTETPSTSKRIKNTFAPNCDNEYFVPATLFGLCKYGFPPDDLPPEAKKMLDEYITEYKKRCTKTGDKVTFPDLPDDIRADMLSGPYKDSRPR